MHLTQFVEKNDGIPMIEEDLRDSGEGSAQESQQLESIVVNNLRREIHRLALYNDTVAYALPIIDDDVPSTHKEAVMCSEAYKWKTSMKEEM